MSEDEVQSRKKLVRDIQRILPLDCLDHLDHVRSREIGGLFDDRIKPDIPRHTILQLVRNREQLATALRRGDESQIEALLAKYPLFEEIFQDIILYLQGKSPKEVMAQRDPSFPINTLETLTQIVERYRAGEELASDFDELVDILRTFRHKPGWEEPIRIAVSSLSAEDGGRLIRCAIWCPEEEEEAFGYVPSPYEEFFHRDLLLAARCLGDCEIAHPPLVSAVVEELFRLREAGDFAPLILQIDRVLPALYSGVGREDMEKALLLLLNVKQKNSLLSLLGCLHNHPPKFVHACAELLNHDKEELRSMAVEAMQWMPFLPIEAVRVLLSLLKGEKSGVTDDAARSLERQALLPEEAIQELLHLLRNQNKVAGAYAARILGKQPSLSSEIAKELPNLLRDEYWLIQSEAAEALGKQSSLPSDVVQALGVLLRDRNREVRGYAVSALGSLTPFPEEIIPKLVNYLKYRNIEKHAWGAETLYRLCARSETMVQALFQVLKDNKPRGIFKYRATEIRCRVMNALGGQDFLPKEVIQELTLLLRDRHERVREAAIQALGHQASLPLEALQEMMRILKDDDCIQDVAERVLSNQYSLPAQIIEDLAGLLRHEDWKIRRRAAYILGEQINLPLTVLYELATNMEMGHRRLSALYRQAPLPDEIVYCLLSFLKDEDWGVRHKAVEWLNEQPNIPDEGIQLVLGLLQDEHSVMRCSAVNVLGNQSSPSAGVIDALLVLLRDEDRYVRDSAWEAFEKHLQ